MYIKKYLVLIILSFVISFIFSQGSEGKDYSPDVHWVFCIDTSGSMKAKGQLNLLKLITEKITNEFLDVKKNIIKPGDRITIFSFDKDVELEITSLYQTEDDLLPIKNKLKDINKKCGNLTFISEAIVQAIKHIEKYNKFFDTNALYIFTDGKSEPYSQKWPEDKIKARKKRDEGNLKRISLAGNNKRLNIWLGVLKWAAYNDAKSFVEKMGEGGHIVDLTDFTRLSLEKALENFAQTVRYKVKILSIADLNFGTIPYRSNKPYRKNTSLAIQTDANQDPPSLKGTMSFDPDNPSSELDKNYSIETKASENKMVLDFKISKCDTLKPGIYKGSLRLLPSFEKYGALMIEPSQFRVKLRKSGFLSSYLWKIFIACVVVLFALFYLIKTIKRKLPVKV